MKRLFLVSAIFAIALALFFGLKAFYFQKNDKIILGQTCPLSGPAGVLGRDARNGALAYFKYINENGGIGGKKIELISLDDKYEPEIARQNAKKLVSEGVFAFFCVVGTPTAFSTLSVSSANNKLFLTPLSGAGFLRHSGEEVVNLREPYEAEIKMLAKYLFFKKKVKTIAVLYQNDTFGADGLWSVKKATREIPIKDIAEYAFNRNTLSFEYAIRDIAKKKPDSVLIIAPYQPCAEFIKQLKKEGLNKTVFCATSFVNSAALKNALGKDIENVVVSEVVPDFMDDSIPVSKLYRDLFARYFPGLEYSRISFEGFMSAMYVSSALSNSIYDLSNSSLLRSFHSINYVGGIKLEHLDDGTKSLGHIYLNPLDGQ